MSNLTLDEVFSPSTPITRENFFIGRFHELQAVLLSTVEPGKHVLLYGERGVGKTSLANMLIAKTKGQKIIKKSARQGNTFSDIWSALLQEALSLSELEKLFDYAEEQEQPQRRRSSFEPQIFHHRPKEDSSLSFAEVLTAIKKISSKTTFIIDEFDLLAEKKKNRQEFASLIKMLSDDHPHITLILIGIAGRSSDLIEQHISLERCLVDFMLPLMNEKEITDLVELGARKAGFHFHQDAMKKILAFSCGYPYYAHMIAKFSCLHAASMNYTTVTTMNYTEGVKTASISLKSLIEKQISHALEVKNHSYRNIALAAASLLTEKKDHSPQPYARDIYDNGVFSAVEIDRYCRKKNIIEKNIAYYLNKLSSPSRGEILQKRYRGGQTFFRFKNPLIKNHLQARAKMENGMFKIFQ